MHSTLRKPYKLLTTVKKRKSLQLQVLIIAMAFAELAGVAAVVAMLATWRLVL
jgi:hypothetical protein